MSEKLAVVVPAYNEAKTVQDTVEAIARDQTTLPDALIVVDNNSTDATAEIVEDLQLKYPLLHLISEEEKGTGVACRTGFRYAIDEVGATIIARTDADTIPRPTWSRAIVRYFANHPNKVSAAGISTYRKDEFFIPQYYLTPFGTLAYRGINSVRRRSFWPLLATFGHNMAVRSEAYEVAGGFAPTKIEEQDEDIELFQKIYQEHGVKGTGFNPRMIVASSQRRRYVLGSNIADYYDNLKPGLTPAQRAERRIAISRGNIDIR